jgi:hypothetical protein
MRRHVRAELVEVRSNPPSHLRAELVEVRSNPPSHLRAELVEVRSSPSTGSGHIRDQVVLRPTCLTPTQRPTPQVRIATSTAHPIAGSLKVPANSERSASTM